MRRDNYLRDLDLGAGYHLNQDNPVMHEVAQGNSLWAFTRTTDGRYVLAAELIVQAKTKNSAPVPLEEKGEGPSLETKVPKSSSERPRFGSETTSFDRLAKHHEVLAGEHLLRLHPLQPHGPHLLLGLRLRHFVERLDRNARVFPPILHEHHATTGR